MARRRGRSPYDKDYRRSRRILLAGSPRCVHCGEPATQADHQPPLSQHEHVKGSRCCVVVPSCAGCSQTQGGRLARYVALDPPPPPGRGPEGFGAEHECWRVPWLEDLLEVPGDAVWPRLMTVPHPDAVDSLGAEFTGWAERRTEGRLRWWQRLVATRLLEVDGDGGLVWEAVLLSMARQL